MAERFPGDGAATNGFGRRWLHKWEARVLHEVNYSTPPDMRVRGAWQLSPDGVPVPPPPSDAERPARDRGPFTFNAREAKPKATRLPPSSANDSRGFLLSVLVAQTVGEEGNLSYH
ncbi:hypothetical protein D1007_37112 [Hordeum vulgare]|nr:hypothetical protein D1007_37112 [Hordeum vulgare]